MVLKLRRCVYCGSRMPVNKMHGDQCVDRKMCERYRRQAKKKRLARRADIG